MGKKVIIVTGSSGFLGSAICVDLCQVYQVVGVDCRPPSSALQRKAPGVQWHPMDISDGDAVRTFFDRLATWGRPIDFVLHMAAFYHFGQHWLPEYERVNVRGLQNILEGACRLGTQRFIFSGSIASLPPPPEGSTLTEQSSPGNATAYTKSKTIGEALLAQYSERMPTLALRIGGVFSDWCELPPLYSLIRLWSKPYPMGHTIPGRGATGFPYIHRRDLVTCVRRAIQRHERLSRCEILFAAPSGCTTHNDLFLGIRSACVERVDRNPIFIAPGLARYALSVKNLAKAMLGRKRYERRWMMDYVDTPLVVDTSYTVKKLEWAPGPELGILNRIPVLMRRFKTDRNKWERRNIRRNEGRYAYASD